MKRSVCLAMLVLVNTILFSPPARADGRCVAATPGDHHAESVCPGWGEAGCRAKGGCAYVNIEVPRRGGGCAARNFRDQFAQSRCRGWEEAACRNQAICVWVPRGR